MPESTVTKSSWTDQNGTEHHQYKTTIPKDLAEAFDMGSKKLDWKVKSGNTLEVRIKDD
mgnify:CR=1 FL=1